MNTHSNRAASTRTLNDYSIPGIGFLLLVLFIFFIGLFKYFLVKENKSFISRTQRGSVSLGKDFDLGKLPPQALDLEESVLGALMLEKKALTDVIDILKPDNFYKDANKEIYQSIIGYDEILLSKVVDIKYKENIINTFKYYFINKFSEQDFENVKTEYAHLRVDLLNKIKENFIQPKFEEKNSSLNYDEYIQKIADQLEDKYHSIKNDLGYEFLRYKDIRLIKTLDTPNNYLIINSEQELNRSEKNININ